MTNTEIPAHLVSAYERVQEAIDEQDGGYSPEGLVEVRLEGVRRDLAEGCEYATAKVPSGYEVSIPAELARWLVSRVQFRRW